MVHTSHAMASIVVQNHGALPFLAEGNDGVEEKVEEKVNQEKVKKPPPNLHGLYNKVMRTVANFLQGTEKKNVDPDIKRVCEVFARRRFRRR
jgi:hypothetical protein